MKAQKNYQQPDFAFPQQVEKGSCELLESSLKEGNDLMALRALMNLCVARNELTDSESIKSNISLIDSVGALLHGEYKSLACLIEAAILKQEYDWNRYIYNERILPLDTPYPEDPGEWSSAMYKLRILELVDNATADLTPFDSIPVQKIQLLLSGCKEAERMGFSVSDFIKFNGVSLLEGFAVPNSVTTIPFYPIQEENTLEGQANKKVRELLNQIIDSNLEENSVISALAIDKMINFLPDDSREQYLKNSIERLKGKEGVSLVVYKLWQTYPPQEEKDKKIIYSLISDTLKDFPKGEGSSLLKYAKESMEEKKISMSLPGTWLPDTPVAVRTNLENLNKGYVLIYKLNSSQYDIYDNLILKKFPGSLVPVQILDINVGGEIPFEVEKDVTSPGLSSGVYVAIPSSSKTLPGNWNKNGYRNGYSTFRVSNISILTTNDRSIKDSGRIYVVSSFDQKPVQGVYVSIYKGSSTKAVKTLVTGKDGSVSVPSDYYRIVAKYGNNVAKSEAGFNYSNWNSPLTRHISILTDLSIYRPGDELQFVAVGWQQDKAENSLVKNHDIEVTFSDANYSAIETMKLSLDGQGRASGKFKIPEGRLLGTYHLSGVFIDQPAISCGLANIEVADYKLPPFEVRVIKENAEDSFSLHFSGVARTYSGMPIDEAAVNISVDFSRWEWGWIRNSVSANYHTSTVTKKDGSFELILPTSNLQGTVFEKGAYTLKAEVISSTGEMVSSLPLIFYLGKSNSIRPAIPDKIEIKGEKINLHIPVYDIAGLPEKVTTRYRFINTEIESDTIRGSFLSPSLSIDSNTINSGRYKLEFQVEGDENWINTETTFWRASETKAPFKTPLWIPTNEYLFTPEEKEMTVTFGSYWKDWILCVISDENSLIEQNWIDPAEGLTHLKVSLPDSARTYFIQLAGMHDLNSKTGNITIMPAKRKEKLEIETLSFRDDITAGSAEKWSFRFKIDSIPSPDVNVFAVMSDKALNALTDFKWNLGIWTEGVYSKVNLGNFSNRVSYTVGFFSKSLRYPKVSFEIPDWETYGFSFISQNRYRFNGPVYYKMASSRALKSDMEYEDDMEMPMAVESAMATADTAGINDSMAELAVEESGETGAGTLSENQETLRPIEMPLAFFKTDLQSDGKGVVNVDFTTPDFNTTWQLQVLGYDERLLNASVILDAMASKTVMTKSNLPMYLRTGDRAEVSALIFNNSADTVSVTGKIMVLDARNEKILVEKTYDEESVEPSGNRSVSLIFDVPDDLDLIAVRCYGYSGNSSDGEQGFIPVYPSSTPVIEAKTFYAKSGEEKIEIKLPKFRKDSNVTLKYCDNPLWEVLLALPSLKENGNGSALSIVRDLYATVMGNDIVNSHPEIAAHLEKILTSEDTTLTLSKLQKDENLKSVSLQATPWVNNAAAETSRIKSLDACLSPDKMENRISTLKTELRKLQNNDGGWCWFEGFKSSPYITSEVLFVLSYLSQAGLLDSELNAMALKGVRYYDEYLMQLKKDKVEMSLSVMLHYIYSRQLITDAWSSGMKEIKKQTLERVEKDWRYGNLAMKSVASLVMLREENYREEAKTIMESIKEFLNRQHPLFEEAWALILFNQEEPESETTEKLREMIYLQKETEDWGSNPYTTGIIHALVVSTPQTVINRSMPEITVNGTPISLSETQGLTGNFTVDLDAGSLSGKSLVINREPGIPAWGGVISQFIQPIKDVKGASVQDLKVDKHIYIKTADGKSKEVKELKKGDKVQVVINIDCKKEMDYVALIDQRAACFQPVDQISGLIFIDGIMAYREVRDNTTSFFIENLPEGKYVISYDCQVEREGEYSLGIFSVQSLYSPAQTAHSSGKLIKVNL